MDPTAKFEDAGTFTPDDLLASGLNLQHLKVETPLDAVALDRGTLMGKITLGAITEDHAGNTGNGAMTLLVKKKNTVAGDYIAECIATGANAGTFKVLTPDGNRLDDAKVGVAYSNDHLGFSIADGAADFILGDKFTITVEEGSGEWIKSVAAAVDGSQKPKGILALATDAGDNVNPGQALVYTGGEFLEDAVTFGAGHTADSVRDELQLQGIILKK